MKGRIIGLFLACSSLLAATSCLDSDGNSISTSGVGSVYYTESGSPYIAIDGAYLYITSDDLATYKYEEGSRVFAKFFIDYDNQPDILTTGIYKATIEPSKFDCDPTVLEEGAQFESDTILALYAYRPTILYRKNDVLLTFLYNKDQDGTLRMVQPKAYDGESSTDTLYIEYTGAKTSDKLKSDYISFVLPQYPTDKDIKLVLRYLAEYSSTNVGDKTSLYYTLNYNKVTQNNEE